MVADVTAGEHSRAGRRRRPDRRRHGQFRDALPAERLRRRHGQAVGVRRLRRRRGADAGHPARRDAVPGVPDARAAARRDAAHLRNGRRHRPHRQRHRRAAVGRGAEDPERQSRRGESPAHDRRSVAKRAARRSASRGCAATRLPHVRPARLPVARRPPRRRRRFAVRSQRRATRLGDAGAAFRSPSWRPSCATSAT